MADSDSNDLGKAIATRGPTPVLALMLILAATAGVYNLSARSGGGSAQGDGSGQSTAPAGVLSGPPPHASEADALEACEPLLRFLNLRQTPGSLEELAGALGGYRVTTVIASLPDPTESRLGYDFDMATEAIQRAIESEGYTLDRFRLPWLDASSSSGGAPAASAPPAAASVPASAAASGAGATPAAPGPAPPAAVLAALRGARYERQPGSILFRIDRSPPQPGQLAAPQELLLLLIVGETPTWGIEQEALTTSLNIAWSLDYQRNSKSLDREPVIRVLAPTFSGTGDSMARVLRMWAEARQERREAPIWVCSGSATAIDKSSFERNASPARALYSASVIPDDILLAALYRFLANPARRHDPSSPALPAGKIALLVETGSGYGSVVGNTYGTSGTSNQSKQIISIPFPSQIAQVRASEAASASSGTGAAAKSRVSIPFDPPTGRQTDRLPALSPKMTVATDSLILSNILTTIAHEDVRYLGIVATDILDVIYLTRLVRENCPDVQIILVGNDLRYSDPQFTLDFRGTIIASSYPLDARAQVWSYPFQGSIERRLFASEFDVGRYNAALVLLNAVSDPDRANRLVVDTAKAEDFLVYGRPFVATFLDSVNRRPQIWINQVGLGRIWPLAVRSLSHCETEQRARGEALIPPIVSLDPQAETVISLKFEYDFPLIWKLVFCVGTFVTFMVAALVLYTNLRARKDGEPRALTSWFDPVLSRFVVSGQSSTRKHLFLTSLLLVALAVPYGMLATPLDVAIPPRVAPAGDREARLMVSWDVYALAMLGILTMLWLLVPLLVCLREAIRRNSSGKRTAGKGPVQVDRWLIFESLFYRVMTLSVVVVGIAFIVIRLFEFALLRPELPNSWLALDRSAHLLGGISPIVPVTCIGAAIFWWCYLELKRLRAYPLLRRGSELISLAGVTMPGDFPWKRVIPRLNARFRLCVDLLEYPVTVLVSKNLPVAGLVVSAVAGLLVLVWGVIWPRFIPTPEGARFDLLIILALLAYLLLLVYSQVRYLWLWRSLFQLFRQISLLPMASAFDQIPPRVAAKFGRFLRTSLQEDMDLEIPLQQCRLVLGWAPAAEQADAARLPAQEALRAAVAARGPTSDVERFEIVSNACVGPVMNLAWPRRSLEQAYGGTMADDGQAKGEAGGPVTPDTDAATSQWLDLAEQLLALRVVYLVSQFAHPLRSMSAQLIYGPLLLLLAVAWYPFHPLKLMSIIIWGFIAAGVLATLLVLLQIEKSDFVSRVSRKAPNSFKLDQTLMSNLLPYAVPVVGFVLTAFPSLGYWLGSLLEPIGRAVK